MKVIRMAICEVLSDEYVVEVVTKMQEHIRSIPYLADHSIFAENGGRLVVLITHWRDLQDCLQYHTGRANRQLIVDTHHLLAGNFVVKFFQNKTERSSL
jgi:hypothetical protein